MGFIYSDAANEKTRIDLRLAPILPSKERYEDHRIGYLHVEGDIILFKNMSGLRIYIENEENVQTEVPYGRQIKINDNDALLVATMQGRCEILFPGELELIIRGRN